MAASQEQVAKSVRREVEHHGYQAIMNGAGRVIRVVVMGNNSIGCIQVLPGSQPSDSQIKKKVYDLIHGGANPVTV